MSLINDALKRAQEAQSQTPPAAQPGPQLRPAEPTSYAWHGVGLMLPAALALVAVLVLFLVWEVSRRRSQPEEVRATADPTPVTQSVQPATVSPPAAEPAPRPPAPGTPQVVSDASTNTPAPVSEDVKPIMPKLQAVIFNPRNPSALINGRSVFRGDSLGSFRVTKITADSATLVGEGQTNVLRLEH
jgi:hypothetical protein